MKMGEIIPSVESLLKKAVNLFKAEFIEMPEVSAFAPGRVNLIGEHIDYNDGFVLPMALPLVTLIAGKINNTNQVRLFTSAKDVDEPHRTEFSLDNDFQQGGPKWSKYVKGVIMQFNHTSVPGFDAVIVTSVPVGGGLSSSAAIEVATFTFLEALTGKIFNDDVLKALKCQKAENEFVGVPCGVMDQLVSSLGKENMALLIDCRLLNISYVSLEDPNLVILITNSNVKHELSDGEYSIRKKQCEKIANIFGEKSWRDITENDLLTLDITKVDKTLIARGRHVVKEIQRTKEAAEALRNKDYSKFGRLMVESHNSLRYDFEVSCKELDEIVEATLTINGVFGSRMTGGGFGGCVVTLLQSNAVHECISNIRKNYSGDPTFYVCKAAGKAEQIFIPKNFLEA